jgi:hypothetical protein
MGLLPVAAPGFVRVGLRSGPGSWVKGVLRRSAATRTSPFTQLPGPLL